MQEPAVRYKITFNTVKFQKPVLLNRRAHLGRGGTITQGKQHFLQATTFCKVDKFIGGTYTWTKNACAKCSTDDSFDGKKGRRIALTRAIKDLTREERAAIWCKVLPKQNRVEVEKKGCKIIPFPKLEEKKADGEVGNAS